LREKREAWAARNIGRVAGSRPSYRHSQGKQGLELAETIVDKIRAAVNKVTFK
jgi:hypothetical protein